jgi:hypothetical protein
LGFEYFIDLIRFRVFEESVDHPCWLAIAFAFEFDLLCIQLESHLPDLRDQNTFLIVLRQQPIDETLVAHVDLLEKLGQFVVFDRHYTLFEQIFPLFYLIAFLQEFL